MIRVVPFRLTMFLSLGSPELFQPQWGLRPLFIRPQRMSSSAISYTSCPLVRGIDLQAIQPGFRGKLVGGWRLGGIVSLVSGPPFHRQPWGFNKLGERANFPSR